MNVGRDFLGRNKCVLLLTPREGSCKWEAKQATALLPREPRATPSGVSGLEPQEALQAGQVPMPGGSRVPWAQGGAQEYAKPYRQGRGESTPKKRDNQAPETRAEPRVESLVDQEGGPEEEQVFRTPSDNEDEGGEWMEPPRPRRQQKRDRDRGYETWIKRSASARCYLGT